MATFGNRRKPSTGRAQVRDRAARLVTTIRLEPHLLDRLDAAAEAHDISRSALVAELVTRMETGPDGRLPGPLLAVSEKPKRHPDQQELDMSA